MAYMNRKPRATPAKKPASQSVTFRTPSTLLDQVDDLAKKNNVDRTAIIQIALTRIVKSGI